MLKNQPKAGYKLTEIGEIPEEWEVVRLGEVADRFISGGTPSTSNPEYWDGNIHWMRSASITKKTVDASENFITEKGLNNSATNIVPKGNILFATRVSIGKVAMNTIDIAISQDLTGVEVNKKKAISEYVYWALSNSNNKTKSLVQGSTIRGMLRKDLETLCFLLPSLPEQKKIAEILSTVDETIQKTDEIIEKTQELKKGLMQKLLTKGIGHTRFKQTEIGEIPEEWEVVRLGEVLNNCEYGLSAKLYSRGKYPIFRMNNIENGYMVENNMKFIELDDKTFKQFKLEKGDILFNRTNSFDLVGKVGIFLLERDFTFASYLIRLRANKLRADPFFINSYLNSNRIKFKLKNMATRGVSQSNINATNLKSLTFLCPPLPEQKKIAEILSGVDEKIEMERKRKEKSEELKKGLMQSLLTGKVRVK